LRPDHEDDQKHDVTGKSLPRRIKLRANRLGDAKQHAARQRSPETAKAAQHDRLSRLGPLLGSKFVHTDMKPAEMATVAPTTPMAMA
jgi:hypothetical protein